MAPGSAMISDGVRPTTRENVAIADLSSSFCRTPTNGSRLINPDSSSSVMGIVLRTGIVIIPSMP